MRTFVGCIQRRLDRQVSAVGLGVFRIAYGCVLFLEVAQLYYFRHFFFDSVPYIEPDTTDPTLALLAWLVVISCLILGLFTRPAAIVNYGFTLASLSRFTTYEYHHDYIVIGINFLLMFLPVGRCLSLDSLIAERRAAPAEPRMVSVLAYEVPVFVGIALVYTDSVAYKMFSPMWVAGLGLWQPASCPYATLFDWGWLLDRQFLVRVLGWLVVLFEGAFIFLMWFRRARLPLLIFGIAFHLGILLVFALPLFALGVASLFLLMIPAGWWPLATRGEVTDPADAGSAARRETGGFTAYAISVFLVLVVVSQGLCLFESPPLARLTKPLRDTGVYAAWRSAARFFLGVHPHAVFMDSRYAPYPAQFAVVHVDDQGDEIWLPVVTARGHASFYSTGRQQVYWVHRVNGGALKRERMEDGIRRLTAFWSRQHGIDLDEATFLIRARPLRQPVGWEDGFLAQLEQEPWQAVGTAEWFDERFRLELEGSSARWFASGRPVATTKP